MRVAPSGESKFLNLYWLHYDNCEASMEWTNAWGWNKDDQQHGLNVNLTLPLLLQEGVESVFGQ